MPKLMTNQLLSINVYNLYREGLLVDGVSARGDLLLGEDACSRTLMSFKSDVLSIGYLNVNVNWKECNYGGIAPIFVCAGCNRNVVVLYDCCGFRCRKCLNLAYPSQNEKELDRTIRRLSKLRKKFGWSGGICSPVVYRGKRQRFFNFLGLQKRYLEEIETLSKDMRKEFSHCHLYK